VGSKLQLCQLVYEYSYTNLIFVVTCITLNSEIIPTRCNKCVYSSKCLYSTNFGWHFHPSSRVQCCIWPLS